MATTAGAGNDNTGTSTIATGVLQGKLKDKETSEPVIGATILLLDDDSSIVKGATSDNNGRFKMNNIIPGQYPLQVSFIGYEKKNIMVNISGKTPTELDIDLPVSPLDLSTVEILGNSSDMKRSIPGALTKLSAEKVELMQPIGTQDALRHIPGVYGFADDGMGNSRISIGIRGLYPRRSSRVLILEDGIPIQPALYLYSNMYYNPPVERLDEIEVIKGSAAIKYGPQTMGGVINYITKKPKREFGATSQITGGTNNYKSAYVSVGGFGSATIHPELQILYKSGDGFRENNHFDQFNSTFKLNILNTKKSNIYIKSNFNYENSNATYTGLTEYSFAKNPSFNPKKYDNFKIFRYALDLIYNKQHTDNLISTTKIYMNHFSRDWWRENDVFVLASDYEENPEIINPVAWYSQGNLIRVGNGKDNQGNLRDFYVLGIEHSYDYDYTVCNSVKANLEAGTRIHFDRFIDDKKTGFTPDARDGVYFTEDSTENIKITGQSYHYETFAVSTYLLNKFHISNRLMLTPGFRFEGFEQERIDRLHGNIYSDKTTIVFLPGIGANYHFGKYNLFSGIHRGFTPPSDGTLKILNFGEDFTEGIDLEAEKSWNTEIGLRRQSRSLSFELAFFNMDIINYIAAGRGTVFENLGKVRHSGMEYAMSFAPENFSKKLKALPNIELVYTYLYTTVLDGYIQSALSTDIINIAGNELPYAPKHSYTISVTKEFNFGLSVLAEMQFLDEFQTDFENISWTENRGDQGKIQSHRLYNLSVNYKINKHFKVFATGKNLMDTQYIGSRLHSTPRQKLASLSSGIIPGPGRQINIGLKYQF